MLSSNDLKTLEVGDAVEADPVFPGVSEEPLVLMVTNHEDTKKIVTFDALWYGINIGVWKADYAAEGVLWQTA